MPSDKKVLDFGFGCIYDDKAVRGIEMFLQTPRATTGVAISLWRQLIHTGYRPLEPGHIFTELEDIDGHFGGSGLISLRPVEDHHQ
jgi:hypothetical protein